MMNNHLTERKDNEKKDKVPELAKMSRSSMEVSFTGRDRIGNKY